MGSQKQGEVTVLAEASDVQELSAEGQKGKNSQSHTLGKQASEGQGKATASQSEREELHAEHPKDTCLDTVPYT